MQSLQFAGQDAPVAAKGLDGVDPALIDQLGDPPAGATKKGGNLPDLIHPPFADIILPGWNLTVAPNTRTHILFPPANMASTVAWPG